MTRRRPGARRIVLLVLLPILAFYLYITLAIAWALWRDGRVVSRGMALGLAVVDAVSVGLVAAELSFGRAVQSLSTAYDGAPADPDPDLDPDPGALPLPPAPNGRFDRAAADSAFEIVKARVQARPDDWRVWYELGLAYGDARDTARGRKAMRRAIELRAGEQ